MLRSDQAAEAVKGDNLRQAANIIKNKVESTSAPHRLQSAGIRSTTESAERASRELPPPCSFILDVQLGAAAKTASRRVCLSRITSHLEKRKVCRSSRLGRNAMRVRGWRRLVALWCCWKQPQGVVFGCSDTSPGAAGRSRATTKKQVSL